MPENAAKPSGPSGEGAPRPRRIGGFELLATLGKGGMGTVYKARQVSMDRVVALKVLPPNLAKNQAFVERFLREARSAAKLNHPNIVQGIDVGEADGLYYFAMEFVDGQSLKDLLKREGRLDEKRALSITGAVARALDHAHKHGIVHRDIKPDNIMISRDGVVKLADLGLARSFLPDSSLPKDSSLREAAPPPPASVYRDTVTLDGTALGTPLGTPHYMAPEQARGDADIDTRADIYALGATLFHGVTGQLPYTAPNAGALMAKHITEPVPNPKDRNPALSRPICDLIQHMRAKAREDRPQTPAELLAEIRDALEGKIKLHRSASPRPAPQAARHPVPSVHPVHSPGGRTARPWLLVAGLLAAAGAAILLFRPWKATQPQAHEKQAPTAQAEGPKTNQPAAKTESEPDLDKEFAALKSQCDDLAAKAQFGPALARLDAFLPKISEADLPQVTRLREVSASLRSSILEKADEVYALLARSADDAIEKKDFPAARAALKPVESLGVPDLADRAKKKLEEIASREKSAEAWAKWDGIKAEAKKLIDAAKLDDAAKLIDGAKALPLDGIADLVAEQTKSIESARSAQLKAALAAYQAESDKVWALFKDRKYAEGDKLLADLPARMVGAGLVPAQTGQPGTPTRGAPTSVAAAYAADQEAAKLLKKFWAAVEKGLAAKAGQFVSFKGAAGGTLLSVQDGSATIKTPKGEEARRVQDLVAKQAVAHADLKDDPNSCLLKGVFLLAEGQDVEAAEKSLAAAGESPALAVYKDRLSHAPGRRPLPAAGPDEPAATPEPKAVAEAPPGKWQRLFDGKSLAGWRAVPQFPVGRDEGTGKPGEVRVEDGRILLEAGAPYTAISRPLPSVSCDYELSLEAMRPADRGDLCSVLFPFGNSRCVLTVGAGDMSNVVAFDTLDGRTGKSEDAMALMRFDPNRWYRVRLRITRGWLDAWVDDQPALAVPLLGRRLDAAPAWAKAAPLAIGTSCASSAAVRNVLLRRLDPVDAKVFETTVAADRGWQETALNLDRGKEYEIAARGEWGNSPGQKWGPAGQGGFAAKDYAMPSGPTYALVGRIGGFGKPFLVGKHATVTADRGGRLWFAINDDAFEDNWGKLQVAVRPVAKAPSAAAEGGPPPEAANPPTHDEKAEGGAPKPAFEPAADDLEQGLLAAYYTGRSMEKFVAAKPLSGALSMKWGFEAPLPDMPVDDFSARFVGWIKIDRGGPYAFELSHDDGARLYLDGKKAIDDWLDGIETTTHRTFLAKGLHRLWVEFYDVGGPAYVVLSWQEKGEQVPVPADRFYCERKLLDAARATPNRNPLLRMGPTDRVRPPELKPGAEQGLVAWWPGEVGGGKWARDLSANRLHGAVVGTVRQAKGRTGLALSFQGGYVEAPDSPLLDLREALTLMAWVRPDQMGEMRLFNKTVVGKNSAFALDILADNSVRLITRFGALKTADTLPLGKWTHVAATFDTAVRRIYLNGELKADGPSDGPLDSTPLALRLGADNEGKTEFHGLLGDIRVFSRTLDPDAIRRLAGIKSP